MSRFSYIKPLASLLLMSLMLLGSGLAFAQENAAKPKNSADVEPLFRITESYKTESVPSGEKSDAAPVETVSGTFRIDVIVPLVDFVPAKVAQYEDVFGITLGSLKIEVKPIQSRDWSLSKPQMRIDYTEGDGKKQPVRVYGKVRVRWTLNKLVMSIEGTVPSLVSPIAVLYTEEDAGKFTGSTIAFVQYGKQAQEFRVNVKGDVKREAYNKLEGRATITTVELSGEGKPLDGEERREREQEKNP